MTHWEKIREDARKLRRELSEAGCLRDQELQTPESVCEAAINHLGLASVPEHPESEHLRGAQAVLEDDIIFFNNKLTGWSRSFTIAHEIGHKVLHSSRAHCAESSIDGHGAAEDSDSSAEKAVGYGAAERTEREANLFALEFLLPCDALRQVRAAGDAAAYAAERNIPFETLAGQLLRAALVPESEIAEKRRRERTPDASQERAARHTGPPLLVSAGPGTGKTQTLADRISFLLSEGIAPHRILALTFSNKAAEEMRERVAEKHPDQAPSIEMMTFHAFGLNILRKYWQRAGLEPFSPLIDKIEALMHLEANLSKLDLTHFLSLSEPTRYLPDILSVISRAKDELCGPERFAELAAAMLRAAIETGEEKLIANAEKACETARVYEFYQNYLDEGNRLDFGDLIFRSVRLLQQDEGVKASVSGGYDAILVDEFQDVNRASGIMLREIAGDGRGLWAVGDIRQSIYRWRGASPSNIGQFNADYKGAQTLALEINYRSLGGIVDVFSKYAGSMIAAGNEVFHTWTANRRDSDAEISLTVAPTIEGEAAAIADTAKRQRQDGIEWRDQAVICRTHRQLVQFSEELGKRGVPVFYLGDVFERSEVRDLLSLLDLAVRNHGHSLVRVAQFPEYSIPDVDVSRVIENAKKRDGGFGELLADESFDGELSERGVAGWRLLRRHLSALTSAETAWNFAARYLFAESRFLDRFFKNDSVELMTARLAIYQFGRFAESMQHRLDDRGSAAIIRFLRYVRRLAWFREDKDLAQIPEAAAGLDAVRLLTVHAAKGLEFDTVFLPYLGKGKFPKGRSGTRCPIPEGLIDSEKDFHEEEEECLFFVALSRARNRLHLSRAEKYGQTNSKESAALAVLANALPAPVLAAEVPAVADETSAGHGQTRDRYYAAELDRYGRCPREFYYSGVCRMKVREDESVYKSFHGMLRESINEARADGRESSFDVFSRKWSESEFNEHSYAELYVGIARDILSRPDVFREDTLGMNLSVRIADTEVRVEADEIIENAADVIVRQLKTGKKPSEPRDYRDVVFRDGAERAFPGKVITICKTYLASGDDIDIEITPKFRINALKRYAEAIDGIRNGVFPARPDDQNCPNCPHYFICPAGG